MAGLCTQPSSHRKDIPMETAQEKCYCRTCNAHVSHHPVPIDHRAHLRTTLFTCGFWAPFWLLMSVSKNHVCDVCGEPVSVY